MKKKTYFKKKVQSSEMLHKLHNIVNKITQYYKILFTRIHIYTSFFHPLKIHHGKNKTNTKSIT